MFRFFVLFTLIVSAVYANDKVEIYSSSVEAKGKIVNAFGGVTIIYKDYILNAQKAIYDKETQELELFGDISATRGVEAKYLGKYAKLNLAKKEKTFKPFFMLDKKSDVWICGDRSYIKDKETEISSGMVSGCNPEDPLWKMKFTSSEYNTQTKWLNLYNMVLFIYDIPVIYTPYFGYSLDTKRRTGLLFPAVGMSNIEGFYYEQPIYIAEQNWWDLELKPQIRTTRGSGIYSTFRFVDSQTSKGKFTTGYFKEKNNYFIDKNLVHETHYGFNFEYENSDFLHQWFDLNLEGQSGIFADINNMNDVDYINLASNDLVNNVTSTQVLSKVNLFYNSDEDYFGAYFKYYKYLELEDNDNTLQKLPTFQYHHYLNTFLGNHLLYNVDLQTNNITRNINKKVVQTDLNIPITLQTSTLDEYLTLSYKLQLYGQHSSFSGSENVSTGDYHDGFLTRYYHVFSESTQLTKAYKDFTHVIGFGSTYSLKGSENRSGFYHDTQDFCSLVENQSNPQCDFYNVPFVDESIKLNFSQYIFDSTAKQILYHRLSQTINYNESSNNKLGELENELDYMVTSSMHYYNNMFFNYKENSFSKLLNTISYSANKFVISLSHLYKDTFLPKTTTTSPYTSYITSSLKYNYNEHYSYHISNNYDYENGLKKSFEVGFLYKKRCWDFGIRYLENIRPVLTQTGSSSIADKFIFFTIRLKPLMPSNQSADFIYTLPKGADN